MSSDTEKEKTNNQKMKKRILFVGIPDMAYICLDGFLQAGANIVGVMGSRPDHETYDDFKKFVEDRKLNFIKWIDLSEPHFLQYIKDLNIDLAVVCSFNYKIPKKLLALAKDGFLNIHPSILPAYRGADPYSSVIINGELDTGVTIHYMDEKFDTGDLVCQKIVPLLPNETMGTLFNRLNLVGMQMMVMTLKIYEMNGELPHVTQPQGDFPIGKQLSDKETRIDFTKSAEEVQRFIRALNPFIIASTSFRGTFMKVFASEFVKKKAKHIPGTIEKVEKDCFYISTSDGLLKPTVVQFGSFFIGSGKDFVEILGPKIGEEFK